MAEEEVKKEESLVDKIAGKFDGHDSSSSSSSSDSDDDDRKKSPLKEKLRHLFGREKPVHNALGGGKVADVFMWRDKVTSSIVLGAITATWLLFEVWGYHLLPLICYGLILALVLLFLWSTGANFINKSPPKFPEVIVPEEPVLNFAAELRYGVNRAFATLRDIASGKDLKKFIAVIAGLWFVSFLGSCCDFLTLLYTITVLLFIVPVLYEKYEDEVDSYAEKAIAETKKQYSVIDAKVLSKIPRGPLKGGSYNKSD